MMKPLLKHISIFLLIPILYCSFNVVFNIYHIKNSKPKLPEINYLILGDSHIQGTIDPKYFKNAVNYAKSGEPYFVSFWKLKFLLEQPKVSLDTVLIGFSHHDISIIKDNALTGDGSYDQFKRSYAIHHITKTDSLKFDRYKYFNTLFRNVVSYPKTKHYYFQGQYGKLNRNLTKTELYKTPPKYHYHFFNKEKMFDLSTKNIDYLDSIAQLCHSKNIYLQFIAAPVSEDYHKYIPKKFKDKFNQLKSEFTLRGIKVHDFSNTILNDSLFADFNHLNGDGSELFMKTNHHLIK